MRAHGNVPGGSFLNEPNGAPPRGGSRTVLILDGTEFADRPSRRKLKLFNPFVDSYSSHADLTEDNNFYGIQLYDSDFDVENSETENDSTSKSTLSSPSKEEPPDGPYNMGSMLQTTLPSLGEGQFAIRDEKGSHKNISSEDPTEDDSDATVLRGCIKNEASLEGVTIVVVLRMVVKEQVQMLL
ncbi:hypothetical protein AK88_05140 [Plasmodium fragile]|uniref:Uncharacterized protein n=1 Tax=Plasmodium fragile TaxID=5857 RepID=A0A0D9QDZ0_PLAFR|nr:uncharacterized protein AK88_05140 [Plasmodium fragile]KJP85213.1 hypothetical protein AK88_05140 [Plasmodium fragile]